VSDITLPRAVIEQVRDAFKQLDYASEPYVNEIARTTLAALDAALAEPEPDAIARAVEAEREAILAHCEAMRRAHTGYQAPSGLVQLIDAIRARGSK
jgi:hypothetical protein